MRTAAALLTLVPASVLLGCHKSDPVPVADPPAAAVPQPPAVEVDAAKEGGTRVGPAVVSVKRAWETRYEGVPTISIALRVECPKEGQAFAVQGWSSDFPLIESLPGEGWTAAAGPHPSPSPTA